MNCIFWFHLLKFERMLEIKPEERFDISEVENELNKHKIPKNILEGILWKLSLFFFNWNFYFWMKSNIKEFGKRRRIFHQSKC